MEKLSNIYTKHKQTFLYLIVFIIIILIIYILYLLERYLVYNIIYYLLKFFHYIFIKNNIYILSLKFEAISTVIYLHIILVRIIVISIIFPAGGFFKKILIINYYISFTSLIKDVIYELIKALKSNNINKVNRYIATLNLFIINDNKEKEPKKDFFQYEKNICNAVELYNTYNNENLISDKNKIKNELIEHLINIYNNEIDVEHYSLKEMLFKYNTYEALLLMENYMIKSFSGNNIEKINITKNFDIYFIYPKKIGKYNNILTIFCNQNSFFCELMSMHKDDFDLYLKVLNCSMIIWNYKGFGLRNGFTTFSNIDKDVDILSNYIKKNFNKYKIIIHGTSIGGYSSIKLMQKFSGNENVVLICDRTFGDIKYIVQTMDNYHILFYIYSFLFPKFLFKYSNIDNYISLPSNKKIILYDKNDEIIPYNPSSLVFCLTKKYFFDIVKPELSEHKEYLNLIENYKIHENELNQICELNTINNFDKNGKKLINKLNKKINEIDNFLMFFVIFGYPFNKDNEINPDIDKFKDNIINIPYIIKTIIDKNKNLIPKTIFELISVVNFLFIKFNLKCELKNEDILNFNYSVDNKELFWIEENNINRLKKYFGCVHRITCGHNGLLESGDIKVIKEFLKTNKFVKEE